VRSTVIANNLPLSVDVTFRTALPQSFFKDEMRRPFFWSEGVFDCGCVQIDGVTVDIPGTLNAYKQIADKNRLLLDQEVNWCKKNNISCIVSDITPFAFDVAKKTCIPSIALSNFTWYDIYSEYSSDNDDFLPYLDEIREQYNKADLFLTMFPANPMEYINRRKDISIIGRKGVSVRKQIAERYGFSEEKKIGLIYIGCYGLNSIQWEKLGSLKEWEFLSLYDVSQRPSNFHIVEKQWFKYQDLTASADVVISKPGYGVVSECFLNGTPLLYIPRMDFAEYPVLKAAIDSWGGGIQIVEQKLATGEWFDLLDEVKNRKMTPLTDKDGVQSAIREILSVAK
jgi:L-arabinokinase